ncbi:VOC family protein [Allobranchiibius sp. GilTou73]|uniref:VOC family protein n=1 Tax=Allobranchiibius sp. GilTou73 TaxID=2904523 RepID=UPI001F405873|nr:VOC family protein [Allobranchiibius sp. GilTou73]UIJ33557.1 VOC family protein [Allobranchiibius sp. GilTou73]
MSTELTTFLWFPGNASEAARFYATVFPDVRIERQDEYPQAAADAGAGTAGEVMTVSFTIGGQRFVGLNGGPQFPFTEAVSFQIACADQAETDRYWDALTADGGEESQCGWCKDRFGVSWQVTPTRLTELVSDPDKDRAGRAMKAMFTMRKIDIAEIEQAAAG